MLGDLCGQWSLEEFHSFVNVCSHSGVCDLVTVPSVLCVPVCVAYVCVCMWTNDMHSHRLSSCGDVCTLVKVQIEFAVVFLVVYCYKYTAVGGSMAACISVPHECTVRLAQTEHARSSGFSCWHTAVFCGATSFVVFGTTVLNLLSQRQQVVASN